MIQETSRRMQYNNAMNESTKLQFSKIKTLWLFFALALSASVAAANAAQHYRDTCDASAAVPVLGTKKKFVVANDENPRLYVYSLSEAKPKDIIHLDELLPGVKPKTEMELEGATILQGLTFFISSHARKKEAGELDLKRHWLFALKIKEKNNGEIAAKLEGAPYRNFLKDLINDPKYLAYHFEDFSNDTDSNRAAKTPDGFNIEGLTVWENNKLLVGLRAPQAGKKAILIPIENPLEVLSGKKAWFGDPVFLDLKGLGIRAIEYAPATGKYWIVAGSYDKEPDFRLFKWSGNQFDQPIQITDIDFKKLNPEAIFAVNGSSDLQILSDDGKRVLKGQEIQCGDALKMGLPVHFRASTYETNPGPH